MALKNETRQFGDVTVTVMEFDAWRGFQLIPRIGTVLGPLAPGADGGIDVGKALAAVCAAVASDQALLLEVLSCTTCTMEGKTFPIKDKESLNVAFSGNLWSLAETLGLVMEVSFTDFLSHALSAIESLGPDPETKTHPPESSSD